VALPAVPLPTDTVAHCLNYALYAGGIADHMAIEASGATVVPVGIGQSRRLLDLIPLLRITAIFGTLSFPAHLAGRAREDGIEPRSLGLRHIVTAGEPGAGLAAVREEIERTWGATVADTFGMSDVWSTMAGACGEGDGLHLTVGDHAVLELVDPDSGDPLELEDGATGELVWTHLRREASPLLRYRSGDLAQVWTSPCPCGRSEPRIRIDGRRDDMLRVQAVNVYPQAIGAILAADSRLGRHCVVAEGDPIDPPLRVYVEAPPELDLDAVRERLHAALRARFAVVRLEPGSLPVAEHKTRTVHRTARGDELPEAVPADALRGALAEDAEIWRRAVALMIGDLAGGELLPPRIYLCGGGAELPDVAAVLGQGDWWRQLPFSRQPRVVALQPGDVTGLRDGTGSLSTRQDVTPMALAHQALILDARAGAAERAMRSAVRSMRL